VQLQSGRPHLPQWASYMVCSLPLLHYLYAWLFWILASIALGRWVEPGRDDPKGFWFGVPLYLHLFWMIMDFAVAPLVLVLGYWRNRLALHALIYLGSLLAAVCLFRMNLACVTDWLAD